MDWRDEYLEWISARSDAELLLHYHFMKRCYSLFFEVDDLDDFLLNGWPMLCEVCAERWVAMKCGDGNV